MLIIMHGAMTRCVVGTVSIRAAKLKGIEAVSVGSKFVRLEWSGRDSKLIIDLARLHFELSFFLVG